MKSAFQVVFGLLIVIVIFSLVVPHIRTLFLRNCHYIQRVAKSVKMLEEFVKGPLEQDDKRLISFIKNRGFIKPPAGRTVPYNLKNGKGDPSKGQSKIVMEIFKPYKNVSTRPGFFIEAGALDGETRSNTLALEKEWGWTGLLVEADPLNFKTLMTKNRKAWAVSCCVAIHSYSHEVVFKQDFAHGQIKSGGKKSGKEKSSTVQCFPIFSLLKALNVSTVDYFSLDIEGAELQVLKTIPFDLIHIKVLSVEFNHVSTGASSIEKFMKEKGYRIVTKVVNYKSNLANDFIFVHKSLKVFKTFKNVTST